MLINPVGALINYSYFPYHATVATWLFPFTDPLGEDMILPLHSVDSSECTVYRQNRLRFMTSASLVRSKDGFLERE